MKLTKKQKNKLLSNRDLVYYIFERHPGTEKFCNNIKNSEFTKLWKKLLKAKDELAKFTGLSDQHIVMHECFSNAANPHRTDEKDNELASQIEYLKKFEIDFNYPPAIEILKKMKLRNI